MLCIGGPLHGKDIECTSECLYAPIYLKHGIRCAENAVNSSGFKKVIYRREEIIARQSRTRISCWVIE